MKKFIILCILIIGTNILFAQTMIRVVQGSGDNSTALSGTTVTIKETGQTIIADSLGMVVIKDPGVGKYILVFSHVGFKEFEKAFVFPLNSTGPIEIPLEPETEELDEVTITSTRSYRTFNHTPTRVEVIDEEEIREEAAMRPGDIRMVKHFSATGVAIFLLKVVLFMESTGFIALMKYTVI